MAGVQLEEELCANCLFFCSFKMSNAGLIHKLYIYLIITIIQVAKTNGFCSIEVVLYKLHTLDN